MRKTSRLLRYLPDRGTVTAAVAAIGAFAVLAWLTTAVFLLYQVISPPRSGADLTVENLLGNPSTVNYTVPGGGEREGWFFPGLRGAPTVILCPGYRSNRGEVLTLATSLQENKYNVFLLDFPGHGKSGGMTSLGYRERRELVAAIDALAQRGDVDRTRFGVWGADIGGYVALAVALADNRVAAVAVDSVYAEPAEMFRIQLGKSGLSRLPLVQSLCRLGFWLLNSGHRQDADLSPGLPGLSRVAKLFIRGRDNPDLAQTTRDLFAKAPEPRQQVVNEKSNYATMLDDEKREYDRRVVSFFLQHLSPMPRASR
jgi:pimeloyl-ACP methyl ester carboxylesterase